MLNSCLIGLCVVFILSGQSPLLLGAEASEEGSVGISMGGAGGPDIFDEATAKAPPEDEDIDPESETQQHRDIDENVDEAVKYHKDVASLMKFRPFTVNQFREIAKMNNGIDIVMSHMRYTRDATKKWKEERQQRLAELFSLEEKRLRNENRKGGKPNGEAKMKHDTLVRVTRNKIRAADNLKEYIDEKYSFVEKLSEAIRKHLMEIGELVMTLRERENEYKAMKEKLQKQREEKRLREQYQKMEEEKQQMRLKEAGSAAPSTEEELSSSTLPPPTKTEEL